MSRIYALHDLLPLWLRIPLPVPLRLVSGVTLSVWLVWELRRHQARAFEAIPHLRLANVECV